MNNIDRSILATLSYYDIFDYPLTPFEIWKYLIPCEAVKKAELSEIFNSLDNSDFLSNKVSQKFGFYFLSGRENNVDKRLLRKKMADQKWKKMRTVFSFMNLVPFVEGVFISGSLAMENSVEDSDIDVLVVAKNGRIWTVRTIMTILTSVLGVRRHGKKTKDRICLNHYITDLSLRIPFESLYNAQSYVHLVNIYKEDSEIFADFQKENMWIKEYVLNYLPDELENVRSINKNKFFILISEILKKILSGKIGNFFEKLFSSVETRIIEKNPLYKKPGGRITINDKQLEFHPDSHENFIIPEFNRRMAEVGLSEFANQKDSGLN